MPRAKDAHAEERDHRRDTCGHPGQVLQHNLELFHKRAVHEAERLAALVVDAREDLACYGRTLGWCRCVHVHESPRLNQKSSLLRLMHIFAAAGRRRLSRSLGWLSARPTHDDEPELTEKSSDTCVVVIVGDG